MVLNRTMERHKDSVYYLHRLSNSIFMWTSMMTVCLWDHDVDSRFWEC